MSKLIEELKIKLQKFQLVISQTKRLGENGVKNWDEVIEMISGHLDVDKKSCDNCFGLSVDLDELIRVCLTKENYIIQDFIKMNYPEQCKEYSGVKGG